MADTRTAAEQSLETAREVASRQFAELAEQSPDFKTEVERTKAEIVSEHAQAVEGQNQAWAEALTLQSDAQQSLQSAEADAQQGSSRGAGRPWQPLIEP